MNFNHKFKILPLIFFLIYLFFYMNFIIFKSGFGFADLTCFTEAAKLALSGESPYFKSFIGVSLTGSGFYYSPAFLRYVSLFLTENNTVNIILYVFLNIAYLVIACGIWIYLTKYFNINILISLLFFLIITHFHPGIVWNIAVANNNELTFLLITFVCLTFLKEKYFLSGLFLAAVFLIKIHFVFFALFLTIILIKNKKYSALIKASMGFISLILIMLLISRFPIEWWLDWLKFIHYRFSLTDVADRKSIDQSFTKLGAIGWYLRYLAALTGILFSLKINFIKKNELLLLCVASISVMLLFFENAWIQYIILFIPLQLIFLIYLLKSEGGIFDILIAIFLCLSLICLNGPFVENRELALKTLPAGWIKNILLIVFNKLRTIGFGFILLSIITITSKQYFLKKNETH